MKSYVKYFLCAIIGGAFCCLFFITTHNTISFSYVILKFGFTEFDINIASLMYLFQWYFPLIMFQIFFGTYIYRHFCCASVYYFSRCNNRVSWFLKEAALLYPIAVIYIVIMISSGTIISSITNHLYFDKTSFILFGYYLIIHSLWLFLTTLLINVLAIKISSSNSFLVVGGIQMFFMALFGSWENKLDFTILEKKDHFASILKLNPLSHLVLKWHSSTLESVNKQINCFDIKFDLNWSILLFFVLSIFVIALGCLIVKRQDMIDINKETGGI